MYDLTGNPHLLGPNFANTALTIIPVWISNGIPCKALEKLFIHLQTSSNASLNFEKKGWILKIKVNPCTFRSPSTKWIPCDILYTELIFNGNWKFFTIWCILKDCGMSMTSSCFKWRYVPMYKSVFHRLQRNNHMIAAVSMKQTRKRTARLVSS